MKLRPLIFPPVLLIGMAQIDCGHLSPQPGETAARGVFQKLYARIDAATESGNTKELATVALPNAEIRSPGGEARQPLSAFIAGYKAGLGLTPL
jgi:hypothetical protein